MCGKAMLFRVIDMRLRGCAATLHAPRIGGIIAGTLVDRMESIVSPHMKIGV
jgi:hypothetical protein